MNTITKTETFTITQARYVTSKIAADLDLMRAYYGAPTASRVSEFAEEAAQLLAKGYLETVEFGFKQSDKVIFSLKYLAQADGSLSGDDRPGRVPAGLNSSGWEFYSWLTYSDAWWDLTESDRQNFKKDLPVKRTGGTSPEMGSGTWEENRAYSYNNTGVRRQVFKPT